MEKTQEKAKDNKVVDSRKPGKAYTVKRFGEAVMAILETDLVDNEDKEQLTSLRTKIAMKYIGM